jgi:hypothetical protein
MWTFNDSWNALFVVGLLAMTAVSITACGPGTGASGDDECDEGASCEETCDQPGCELELPAPRDDSDVEVTPRSLAFERSSQSEEITISRVGEGPVQIAHIELAEGDPEIFDIRLEREPPFVLYPGDDPVTVDVKFHEWDYSGAEGTLVITSSDPDEPLIRVPLQGVAPRPKRLEASVDMLQFDRLLPGESTSKTVEIESVGEEAFDFWSIRGDHEPLFDFALVDENGVPADRPDALQPGQSVWFEVTYQPRTYTSVGTSLKISAEDSTTGEFSLPVEVGLGQPCTRVSFPQAVRDAQRQDFGIVDVGVEESFVFQVSACHQGEVDEFDVDIEGDDAFAVAGHPTTLDWQSQEVEVTFEPTNESVSNATLVISSEDPVRPEVRLPLTGEGNRNECPVAKLAARDEGGRVLGNPARVTMEEFGSVELDASESVDPDGNDANLSYVWERTLEPSDLERGLSSPDEVVESVRLGRPGTHTYTLTIRDEKGLESCESVTQTVIVEPSSEFYLELLWETPDATHLSDPSDLDLYMRRSNEGWTDGLYYDNPQPDWGMAQDPSDDPVYTEQSRPSFGPELVEYDQPQGEFVIGVHDYPRSSTGFESSANLRAYYQGQVVYEAEALEFSDDDFFEAFRISFDNGQVEPIETWTTGVQ